MFTVFAFAFPAAVAFMLFAARLDARAERAFAETSEVAAR